MDKFGRDDNEYLLLEGVLLGHTHGSYFWWGK